MFRFLKSVFISFLFLFFFINPSVAGRANGGIVLRRCQSIHNQLDKKNVQYIISKRINLKGQTINIPQGSTLVFQKKGRFVNGIIVGNQTKVQAEKRTIFDNVTFDKRGTWKMNVSYPEWFGACDKKTFDSKMAIQMAIDVADTCVLSQHYYTSYDTPTGRGDDARLCAIAIANTVLLGEKGNKLLIDSKFSNTEKTTVFYVGDNVIFDGVNIEFFNEDHSGWTGTQAGVYSVDGGNVTIQNTTLRGAMAAWINLIGKPGRTGYVIKNNFVHDCDCGLIIQGNQHTNGEVYSIKLLMEGNAIEKEKEPHSEFVSFWGSCKDVGVVYYTNVTIRKNHFSGGTIGGCISGHHQRCGLKNVVITDNTFYDCGACTFYNADGLVYTRNYVVGSTFIERQVKGINGSYPHLNFNNCVNCTVDDISCFGLTFDNCRNMRIGKIKQTLCLKEDDTFFLQKPEYITNFIGVRAKNSNVLIDELTINPFENSQASSDKCRYYVHSAQGSNVRIKKTVSSIPIQMSTKCVTMGNRQFNIKGSSKNQYIDTTK